MPEQREGNNHSSKNALVKNQIFKCLNILNKFKMNLYLDEWNNILYYLHSGFAAKITLYNCVKQNYVSC